MLKVEKLIEKNRKLAEMAQKAAGAASQGIMSGKLENIKVAEMLQILNFMGLAVIGLILFAGTTLFTIVTLPVELDASRRAMNLLRDTGLLATEQDAQGARAVLTAAAFTYVAAVATSLLTLLYYAMIVFGGRSRD